MDPGLMAETITASIHRNLKTLRKLKPDSLVTRRSKKFRSMGIFSDR
jgi:acetyl-CoA carboxylase alpha subunit